MDFFDEVQQEVHIDKVHFFFHKHLKIIIVVAFLILTFFIGYYFWKQHSDNLFITAANEYDEAIEADDKNKANLLRKIADNNNDNIFTVMAHMKLAEIASNNRDFNKAVYYYKQACISNNTPKEYADYAELMSIKAEILLERNKYAENILLLEKYIDSKKIFTNLARLYLASIYIDNDKKQEAQNQLNYLLTSQFPADTVYIVSLARELIKKAQIDDFDCVR